MLLTSKTAVFQSYTLPVMRKYRLSGEKKTFTGTAPATPSSVTLKVTATDTSGLSNSETFGVTVPAALSTVAKITGATTSGASGTRAMQFITPASGAAAGVVQVASPATSALSSISSSLLDLKTLISQLPLSQSMPQTSLEVQKLVTMIAASEHTTQLNYSSIISSLTQNHQYVGMHA